MKLTTLVKIRKFASADRETILSELIRRYLSGKLNQTELRNELERLYNRHGDAHTTLSSRPLDSSTSQLAIGHDPLYKQVLDLITSSHLIPFVLAFVMIRSIATPIPLPLVLLPPKGSPNTPPVAPKWYR